MNARQSNNNISATAASARLSALFALVTTLDKSKPLDASWTQDRHFSMLSPSDRAFAQLLAKTTLRRLGQIDALLAEFLEKPIASSRIMHTLRLGAAQLLFLDTPPHAAVHSAVEMTKQIKMEKFSGLVNAVLKKVSQQGKAMIEAQDAAKLNTPGWLWANWEKAYGAKTARAIADAHMNEPPLDISVKSNPALWAEKLSGEMLPGGSVRLKEARGLTQLAGFAEGEWWVQDAAAALPARLLGNVKGKSVIDFCAAPGGKTAQLAASGAEVTAVELSKERTALLKTNLKRLKLAAECITADALKWTPKSAPDAILLDAPCSATGTLRRHPDVAQHRAPNDITRLTVTQYALLNHALDMLKPGGTLVYAVCSLQPEEGEMQISKLLKARKDVTLLPVSTGEIGGLEECITKSGEVRTLPCHMSDIGGMDGFYAARMKKKGSE